MQNGMNVYGSGGGGGIKSIQRGSATFAAGSSTLTVAVSAVVPSKTMCRYLGVVAPTDNYASNAITMALTNATTITFTRGATTTSPTVGWELIEGS